MKKYIILLFISILLLTVSIVNADDIENKLVGKVIVLDAGHGGKDKGAMVGGIYESDINLKLVLKLRDVLIKKGVDVVLTRDADFDLSSPNTNRRKKSDFDNRIDLINNSNADLYLSIHLNYLSDNSYYGGQVFYDKDNGYLANIIQKKLNIVSGAPRESKKLSNSIYMYKQLEIPGVLIECGFLSNKKERALLKTDEYQDKIVNSIIEALIEYY